LFKSKLDELPGSARPFNELGSLQPVNQLEAGIANERAGGLLPFYNGSTKRGRDSQGSPDQSPADPPKKPRTDSVKDGQVSDEDMENLAEQLGDEWVKLGRRLKVSHAILRGLSRNTQLYPDLSLKAYEMLSKWRNREGDSATYQVLYEALCHEHVGRKDLAQTICCHK